MTDKDRLVELLQSFGIGFKAEACDDGKAAVICKEGMPEVDGYQGFYVSFEFTESGEFVSMGIWE